MREIPQTNIWQRKQGLISPLAAILLNIAALFDKTIGYQDAGIETHPIDADPLVRADERLLAIPILQSLALTKLGPNMFSKLCRFLVVTLQVSVVIVIGLIIALFCGAFSRGNGSHVASVSWLPKSANDISYHENDGILFYGFTYECTMSPEDFQSFAKQSGWKMEEKLDFHSSVSRQALGLPPFNTNKSTPPNRYAFALVYENVGSNGGGIRVIYDPVRRRLLFDESTH